jgi:hypothetical protein
MNQRQECIRNILKAGHALQVMNFDGCIMTLNDQNIDCVKRYLEEECDIATLATVAYAIVKLTSDAIADYEKGKRFPKGTLAFVNITDDDVHVRVGWPRDPHETVQ